MTKVTRERLNEKLITCTNKLILTKVMLMSPKLDLAIATFEIDFDKQYITNLQSDVKLLSCPDECPLQMCGKLASVEFLIWINTTVLHWTPTD